MNFKPLSAHEENPTEFSMNGSKALNFILQIPCQSYEAEIRKRLAYVGTPSTGLLTVPTYLPYLYFPFPDKTN